MSVTLPAETFIISQRIFAKVRQGDKKVLAPVGIMVAVNIGTKENPNVCIDYAVDSRIQNRDSSGTRSIAIERAIKRSQSVRNPPKFVLNMLPVFKQRAAKYFHVNENALITFKQAEPSHPSFDDLAASHPSFDDLLAEAEKQLPKFKSMIEKFVPLK